LKDTCKYNSRIRVPRVSYTYGAREGRHVQAKGKTNFTSEVQNAFQSRISTTYSSLKILENMHESRSHIMSGMCLWNRTNCQRPDSRLRQCGL